MQTDPHAVAPPATPRTPAHVAHAADAFVRLHRWIDTNAFRGYEFDDLLGSPLLKALAGRNLLSQRIVVQVGELCPFNLRPLLGVPKLESTKARGFFAKGYLLYYRATGDDRWLARAEQCLQWLLQHSAVGFPGMSWGNAFDFASRGGFFPKGLPTIVWTGHIAETLDLAHSLTGKPVYRDAVDNCAQFILKGLPRHEDADGICFAYAPGRMNLVHNSNLLGAATLLRCWKHSGDRSCFELARAAYGWTLAHRNDDWSWYYGVGPQYQWIDNFHTAYVIDALGVALELADEDIVPASAIENAYRFWTSHFILEDGAPRYYHDSTYPLDIQCAAQAIESLSKLSRRFSNAQELADRVTSWTLTHMQKQNGSYRYQIRRFWKNDLESIHWGQSTMLAALGAYLCDRSENIDLRGI